MSWMTSAWINLIYLLIVAVVVPSYNLFALHTHPYKVCIEKFQLLLALEVFLKVLHVGTSGLYSVVYLSTVANIFTVSLDKIFHLRQQNALSTIGRSKVLIDFA